MMSVFEIRVAITAKDYDKRVTFYRDGLGLDPDDAWAENGRGQLLHTGIGVLEILDEEHATSVEAIEVGEPVSGPMRFAFRVPDVHEAVKNARQYGATVLREPTRTPWNDLNARVVAPDGMHITLFQVLDESE